MEGDAQASVEVPLSLPLSQSPPDVVQACAAGLCAILPVPGPPGPVRAQKLSGTAHTPSEAG